MDAETIKLIKRMKENKTIVQFEFNEGESWFASSKHSPFSVADTYLIAADIAISEAKNYDVDDIIGWPVIFLYRHAIELYLKKILEQVGISSADIKVHGIDGLFELLDNKLSEIMNSFKEKGIEIDLLPNKEEFSSIMEFHSVSPRSTELRYPDSQLLGDSNLLFLNFINAQFHARRAKEYFKKLENILKMNGWGYHNAK